MPPHEMTACRVGKAVTYTFGAVLAIFLLSPAHDMYLLHQQKEASAETLTSQDRRHVLVACAGFFQEAVVPAARTAELRKERCSRLEQRASPVFAGR